MDRVNYLWRHKLYYQHLHTLWSRVILEKLIGSQLVKKFPTFSGTRKFITTLTRARQLSLSWTRSIQSMPPHPTSWRFILIVSSYLRLDLPNGLFASSFSTKILYTLLLFPIRATCIAHITLLDLITRTTRTTRKMSGITEECMWDINTEEAREPTGESSSL
jgi:hypothetical protein